MSTETTIIHIQQGAPRIKVPSAARAEDHAQLLKAVADPVRLRMMGIIASLGGNEICACEFPAMVGVSQPTASHHLKKLTDAGLLAREQRGKWAYFSIVEERVEELRATLQF